MAPLSDIPGHLGDGSSKAGDRHKKSNLKGAITLGEPLLRPILVEASTLQVQRWDRRDARG